jgi:uncharacterized protein (TIGR01777 family)
MMKVLISGSHGMVGRALTAALGASGVEIYKLSRKQSDSPHEIFWNTTTGEIDAGRLEAIGGVNAVIHLAGENVGERRWSEERKRKIYESRVPATQKLSVSLAQLSNPPRLFVGASAVGYYGNRGEEILTESSAAGSGFLARTCMDWEAASAAVATAGTRIVHLRFGMILSRDGGALKKMLPIFKLALGGPLGSGKQWMSWVSLRDVIRVIQFVLNQESPATLYNTVAPEPVRNRDFTKTLGRALRRPTFVSAPAFALRMMFGEMADEALLTSARVVPGKLLSEGFQFQDRDLECVLNNEVAE